MKTSTLALPVAPEVAGFAVVIEAKLRAEGLDDSSTWKHVPTGRLVEQLERKVEKLKSLDPNDAQGLFSLAVVIGNLSMMIADRSSRALEVRGAQDPLAPRPRLPPKGVEANLSTPRALAPFRHRVKTVSLGGSFPRFFSEGDL